VKRLCGDEGHGTAAPARGVLRAWGDLREGIAPLTPRGIPSRGSPSRSILFLQPDVRDDRVAEGAVALLLSAPLVLDRSVRVAVDHGGRCDAARPDVVRGMRVGL